MDNVARYRVMNGKLCSATGTATSPAIDVTYSQGYFSIATLITTAGATAKAAVYYRISGDGTNWEPYVLATEVATEAYQIEGIDPSVCKHLQVQAIGTGDNSASNTIDTWLMFTTDI